MVLWLKPELLLSPTHLTNKDPDQPKAACNQYHDDVEGEVQNSVTLIHNYLLVVLIIMSVNMTKLESLYLYRLSNREQPRLATSC